MPNPGEMMQSVFGTPKVETPLPPAPAPVAPVKPPKGERTVGDVGVMAEGQRIYNPDLPTTKPKAPSAPMMEQGTAGAMDTTQAWGKPNE